jgi:undecaprenyl-diphosphatase
MRELDPEAIDDDLLARVWDQARRLHAAHVVHGRLDADHVVIGAEGPYLVGFVAGTSSGSAQHAVTDIVQLLAATAGLVGDERAARAASDALGDAAMLAALPWLQPAVLTRETRQHLGAGRGTVRTRLNHLRDTAGDLLGVETPELRQLQRVSGTSLAMAVGTLVAAGVLLTDIGDPTAVLTTFQHGIWSWLVLAMILSLASNIGFAMGLQGTVAHRLPIWPTTELQVAMSFSNLAIPGIGGIGVQVRYLQKQGIDLSSAVASGGLLSTVGNLAAAIVLFGLALAIDPGDVDLSLLPTGGLAEFTLATAAVIGIGAAVIGGIPRIRRAVMPPVIRGLSTMWAALRSPRQVALLLGGNVLATLLAAWCLLACLLAFGGHISFWPLLAANVGVITIASIVPIPGGSSAVGTVGLTAVLVAFGVRSDIAVAAVLANQLIYFYLPAIPGWFATRDLAQHDFL